MFDRVNNGVNNEEVNLKRLIPYYHDSMEDCRRRKHLVSLIEKIENLPYEDFLKAKEKLPQPSFINADTVASYIFGCDKTHYGEVGGECSILCALSKSRGHSEYRSCSSQIWSFFEGKLRQIENAPSYHALIYLNRKNEKDEIEFKGFTYSDLNELSERGVERVSLIVNKNNLHQVLYEKYPLEKLPTDIDFREGFTIFSPYTTQKEEKKESFFEQAKDDYVLWTLLILVIILLTIFFVLD